MNVDLTHDIDFWIAIRDLATERLSGLERAQYIERQAAELLRWREQPRRPVAGNQTETTVMLTEIQRAELKADIEAELTVVEKENMDDMLRMQQLERRHDIRRAEVITNTMLTTLRRAFPDVADTVAHAALRFAVAWLGCNHGREFVQGRVAEVLDAKLDG